VVKGEKESNSRSKGCGFESTPKTSVVRWANCNSSNTVIEQL